MGDVRLPLTIGEQLGGRSVSSVPRESRPSSGGVSIEGKPAATDIVSIELRSGSRTPILPDLRKVTPLENDITAFIDIYALCDIEEILH